MVTQNKKKTKKVDILEMEVPKRNRMLEEMKKQLKHTIAEAKLMHALLQVENLTVNGNIVYKGDEQLTGFSL